LQEHREELKTLDVQPALVTFEAGFMARAYVEESGLEWPMLIDENRDLYRAYSMLHASFWEIWGPATQWAYAKEFVRGRMPRKSSGDLSQRGGDVLVDPTGIVRLHHIGRTPADRPPVESILRRVAEWNRMAKDAQPSHSETTP
jgi:alkyl hydroperoxide reductase subunit AhpC